MARSLVLAALLPLLDAHSYTKHEGYHCHAGFGGTPMTGNETAAIPNQSLAACQTLCTGNISCVAFAHDSSQGGGGCQLSIAYDLGACDQSDDRWSTYTLNFQDMGSFLQEQAETVLAHYRSKYPDLAISMAWKDAEHEVSVAVGSVSDRKVLVDDTFLYGSGTKPVTAVGVLRLVDAGKVHSDDKAHAYIDPYLRAHGRPRLAEFFGEEVNNATVLQLIRMSAGIRDFEDDYSYDAWMLGNSSQLWEPYDAMKFAVSDINVQAGGGEGKLICNPGTCTAYSSTSYIVAGLLLASVLEPGKDWYDFDLASAVFDNRSEFPSVRFAPEGLVDDKLSDLLTVPGQAVDSKHWERTTLYKQNPSILGWTCGNMVATPRDVALFFHRVFNKEAVPIISDEARAEMTRMTVLTQGWSAGYLMYGAGLMALVYGSYSRGDLGKLIFVQGHEGDTYAFASSQGFVPSLNGSYSIATNVDNFGPLESMACVFLQSVQQALLGFNKTLGCSLLGHIDGEAEQETTVLI
mmetsp:Transcript_130759/g.364404  ORF Transcript_130759/g.364404 Transcript_130759/m.364404 type:complete len:519 (-) Transcript_130759:308-1864(-)